MIAGADLRIALMHHPFEWLADFDREVCEPLLMERCDFILRGHVPAGTTVKVCRKEDRLEFDTSTIREVEAPEVPTTTA